MQSKSPAHPQHNIMLEFGCTGSTILMFKRNYMKINLLHFTYFPQIRRKSTKAFQFCSIGVKTADVDADADVHAHAHSGRKALTFGGIKKKYPASCFPQLVQNKLKKRNKTRQNWWLWLDNSPTKHQEVSFSPVTKVPKLIVVFLDLVCAIKKDSDR